MRGTMMGCATTVNLPFPWGLAAEGWGASCTAAFTCRAYRNMLSVSSSGNMFPDICRCRHPLKPLCTYALAGLKRAEGASNTRLTLCGSTVMRTS